jgi:dihydrofolate synthase/folylpolyglutamate synthase
VATLAEWLELQERVHVRSIDLGLERLSVVAERLGLQRAHCPVITVGGTNGKGSVVEHVDALLRGGGVSTGLFTSPHLVRYNERIRVDGAEVTDAELVAAFERIEAERGDTTLTFFEFNALAAVLIFAERKVQVMTLEVGLGGRLDAVNHFDADVAVVCSIGMDHRDWLGDTLDSIGREKAGIFRAGRPAVLGTPQMPRAVFETIDALGARAIVAERDFTWQVAEGRWSYRGPSLALADLPPSALAGDIQYRNAATAIAAVEALGATPLDASIAGEALRGVRLAGRFQVVPGPVEWILDVAHNEPAARVFAEHLAARPCSGRTFAVCGILGDKDAAAIAHNLDPVIDRWILCTLPGARGVPARELAARMALEASAVALADSVEQGCQRAQQEAKPGDRIVAFGSFLVVGSVLEWLRLY